MGLWDLPDSLQIYIYFAMLSSTDAIWLVLPGMKKLMAGSSAISNQYCTFEIMNWPRKG